jgi:hypothetical protein
VHFPRLGALRSLAASAFFALFCWAVPNAAGATETVSYDVADGSVVFIHTTDADVTVRTWDRNVVSAEWDDDRQMAVSKRSYNATGGFAVPKRTIRVSRAGDPLRTIDLPPEDFPIDSLAPGLHDMITFLQTKRPDDFETLATASAHLTVTIPASTGSVFVRTNKGAVTIEHYRGTGLVFADNAQVFLNDVQGAFFLQVVNGRTYAIDSIFERLRARSNNGAFVFERCSSKQIDVQTYDGVIVYDDGRFQPGLARFASENGDIAIGTASAAQLAGRSVEGHVYTNFDRPTQIDAPVPGQANAILGPGGPLITVSTVRGNAFLYDGGMDAHRPLALEWRPVAEVLVKRRRAYFPHPFAPAERRGRMRRVSAPTARTFATPRRRA